MKLKTLEATGFKSFVDRLHLSFTGGITTIVGPNGCGKSNVVDAILWVIGERSAKHLRGKSMEDVIFGGTDGRKPLGMAEVSLTFSNEDRLAPAAYEAFSEITITRRLFRSGESEYLINKVPCRLRDITDLFLDTGIGVNGYSIVEQGRVERLINANPQDRRFLIEEAAGIAKYKERKRLALLKMDAATQNLLRIQDIVAEVKRQIATLEKQVKRAEEYKTVRKEIKEIEIRFAVQDYAELSEKGDAIRGYLKALREREQDVAGQTAQKEAWIEGMRLNRMEEEERQKSLQQGLFDLGRAIQKTENETEFLRREVERLKKQENQLREDVRNTFQTWKETQRERRKTEQSRRELEQERDRNETGLREMESLFAGSKERFLSMSTQLEEEKGALTDTLTSLTSFRNRLSHLEERRKDLQKRMRYHEEESEGVRERLSQLEASLSETVRSREEGRSVQSALQEERVRWEREIESLRQAFQERQGERLLLAETLRQDSSRYLSLKELQENFEGYEKGVRSILLEKKEDRQKWDGILGAVADILEPDPQYEIPLEAVLGQRLQFLMVENEEKGVEAIDFLKKQALGRVGFIPKGVRGRGNGQDRFPAEGKESPLPLSRFINVKEGYAAIADTLIGDVGVVKGWTEALPWMKEEGAFEVLVTLDGDVFERSGILSGGSRGQGLGLLERRREIRDLEAKVREEEERHREALEVEQRLSQEIQEREKRLEERKRELQEKEIELLHRERDLEGLSKEISQVRQNREVLQYEWNQFEEEQAELNREENDVHRQAEGQEVRRMEQEEKVQCLKRDTEALSAETEQLGGAITERKVRQASLEEKQRGLEAQGHHLSESLAQQREQILKKIREIREGRQEILSIQAAMEQQEKDLESGLAVYRQKEEDLAIQKEKVEALSNEWKEAEASSRFLRRELDEVREKIHEEEMRMSEVQLKLQHLQESVRDRYGTFLSSVPGTSREVLPREEMSRRLEELKRALEGMGEVNLMALEEYQELKQRHDFLSEQQADLQQALDLLKKAILRINRTTTKRFVETFQLVNEKFKEVFTRLFKGGQASLLFLDEQDPSTTGIDILAQPPGKKLQNIDLLSGGEKALVAIAFLFGLFMIRPTPFCFLDEIDAPLDDANINRFIGLIKEFSRTSQFVLITHNKNTMEAANTLYGITMETPGVSKVVSVRLN
jgi:chromosome segregation protein